MLKSTLNESSTSDICDVVVFSGRELQLWSRYRTMSSGREKTSCLHQLIEWHHPLIQGAAGKRFHSKFAKSRNGDFEDYLQESKIAAISAYESYRPQSSSPTDQEFRNYIYGKIYFHLCDYDLHGLITCPKTASAWRSWVTGCYDEDPDKKEEFERSHGLLDEESRREARLAYCSLARVVLDVDLRTAGDHDEINTFFELLEGDGDFSSDLLAQLDVESALDEAVRGDYKPERSKEIFNMICGGGMSVTDVVNALGVSRAVVRESIHETRVKIRQVLSCRK